jgi:hypothetical protein
VRRLKLTNIKNIDFLKVGQTMMGMILGLALTPAAAYAQGLPEPNACVRGLRCDTVGPNDLIVKVLTILLGVAFLVAVLFLVIGGFRYIISAGNDDAAKAGRKTVFNALIGIVIIILSYVIVSAVSKGVGNG